MNCKQSLFINAILRQIKFCNKENFILYSSDYFPLFWNILERQKIEIFLSLLV